MPLKPINLNKPGFTPQDNRIISGRIIEYEQHSKPILAVAVSEKKGKWSVINQQGAELDLPPDRLTLIPGAVTEPGAGKQARLAALAVLHDQAVALLQNADLAEVWQVYLGETKEVTIEDAAELLFGDAHAAHFVAARRMLLTDQIYFRRKKSGFEPRSVEIVEELQAKLRAEQEKAREQEEFVAAIVKRLAQPSSPIMQPLHQFELLAALGSSAPQAKETRELLETICQRAKLNLNGRPEEKAFELLVALDHFNPDQDLGPIRLGRPLLFRQEVISEAQNIAANAAAVLESRTGLAGLTCVTIDGEETRDFDDALSLELLEDVWRVGIHISDVAAVVLPDSHIDQEALRRASSIYTPDYQVPMIPREISEDTLSLIEGAERLTLSVFVDFDRATQQIVRRTLQRTRIQIAKRFTYEEADALLCAESRPLDLMQQMLLNLWHLAAKSEERRLDAGALQFDRREMSAKILPGGKIALIEANEDTPARRLVSELMILGNESAALFGAENGIPLIFRAQEPPDTDISQQGKDLPEGPAREYFLRSLLKRSAVSITPAPHSGVGVAAYTQSTSPIRRAVDLITQRQLGTFLDTGKTCYSPEQVSELIGRVECGADEVFQIQRERNRYWLLKYLLQERIKEINGVIVRVDGLKPMAELDGICALFPFFPAGGRNAANTFTRKDLGRRVRLQIENINPRNQTLILREML
ncbi:MAG TPA: RNB domain-containing ribonuclease [Oligoflexia bacterium]|nr:RNB domain-containing ribonuclease [Oligoflexia bacterium]